MNSRKKDEMNSVGKNLFNGKLENGANIQLNNYTSTWNIDKFYPIPQEYKNIAVYCKVLIDGSKAFYYDENKNFLCEVNKTNL